MCWSGEASFGMAAIGFAGAAFEWTKRQRPSAIEVGSNWQVEGWTGHHVLRAATLFYFSLMELLQGFNYMVLDQPGPMNSLCAFLGYVHISFQVIFVSWFMLSFLPRARRMKHFKMVTWLSIVAAFLALLALIKHPLLPGCFGQNCVPMRSLTISSIQNFIRGNAQISCSIDQFRSYVGDWHIAWQWNVNSCFQGSYVFISFILPIYYGAYRVMLYVLICGPVLAFFLTGNPDEWAAIWCLLSIGFLIGVKVPWLERFLTVKDKGGVQSTVLDSSL